MFNLKELFIQLSEIYQTPAGRKKTHKHGFTIAAHLACCVLHQLHYLFFQLLFGNLLLSKEFGTLSSQQTRSESFFGLLQKQNNL